MSCGCSRSDFCIQLLDLTVGERSCHHISAPSSMLKMTVKDVVVLCAMSITESVSHTGEVTRNFNQIKNPERKGGKDGKKKANNKI